MKQLWLACPSRWAPNIARLRTAADIGEYLKKEIHALMRRSSGLIANMAIDVRKSPPDQENHEEATA
jgi:hypothetical protein